MERIVARIKEWIQEASIEVGHCNEFLSAYGERHCDDYFVATRDEKLTRIEALEDVLNLFKEYDYDGEGVG